MSASFTKIQQLAAGIVLLVVGALLAGATSGAKTRFTPSHLRTPVRGRQRFVSDAAGRYPALITGVLNL